MKKYNFIIVCRNNNLYDYIYKQISDLEYAYFDNHFPENRVAKVLNSIHYSNKLNKIVNLPYKSFWINLRVKYYKKLFDNMETIYDGKCIVLFSDCIPLEKYGLSESLRKIIPDVKIVYFFQDIVLADSNKIYFLDNERELADLIYSFDGNDSSKYHLGFHNVPYSDLSDLYPGQSIKYDICFIGRSKNRLEDVLHAFKKFQDMGCKTAFYLVGVDESERKYTDQICYCNEIPYSEYLRIVSESRCMLEIIQKGSSGNTIRVSEAIVFNKVLISNNKELLNNPLYDQAYMFIFDNLDDLNLEEIIQITDVEYMNKKKISPEKFLQDIEDDLNKI